MKTQVSNQVVIAVIVVVLLIVAWVAYVKFKPGSEKANVGLGPPAELIKKQPPPVGPGGTPLSTAPRPYTTGTGGGAAGGIGPPPPPSASGFRGGGGPPPPPPPNGYR